MTVRLEQFVKHLEDSGILGGDTLKDFIPPKATPKDAEELARELVRKKKLTRFQAEQIYAGNGKSLTLGNYLLLDKLKIGDFAGMAQHDFVDYVYFSIVAYSTLGLGDVAPIGGIRLIAGVESLNGLVLVGWSASFTYLVMEAFWPLHGSHGWRRFRDMPRRPPDETGEAD